MSRHQPTSFRFSPDELELLDATAAYMLERHGMNHNRTSVIRELLRRSKPPTAEQTGGLGPAAVRYRRAYSTIFGGEQ